MADEVGRDVGQILLGLRLRFVFADFNEQNLFRLLQEWERVTHRAAAFARILPGDDHAAQRQRSDGIGNQQNGTAGAQHDNSRVQIVAAAPATDDEKMAFMAGDVALTKSNQYDLRKVTARFEQRGKKFRAQGRSLKQIEWRSAVEPPGELLLREARADATPMRADWKRSARARATCTRCLESRSISTWTIIVENDIACSGLRRSRNDPAGLS